MARTNLLRSIKRAGRQVRFASRNGIPVDEVLGLVSSRRARRKNVTRREFLTTIGMGGAGLILSEKVSAALLMRSRARIAIIGGGISGLNCALTLADHGVRSTIYEA